MVSTVLFASFRAQAQPSGSPPPAAGASGRAESPAADGDALKAAGDKLREQRRYREAIDVYEEAYRVGRNAAVLYNRGRCHEFLGEWPAALEFYERFAAEASPDLRARVPDLDGLLATARASVGRLAITSNVSGARIIINDKIVGQTPLANPIALNTGAVRLEIVADEFLPFRRDVTIVGGKVATLEASLMRRSNASVLRVKSAVDGAVVFVDGSRVGLAPTELQVSAGTHRIRVERAGYDPADTNVVIQAGVPKEIALSPESAGLTRKAPFWIVIGAAVLVAGGVATYVAVTTEKSSPKGTLDTVSAPLGRF